MFLLVFPGFSFVSNKDEECSSLSSQEWVLSQIRMKNISQRCLIWGWHWQGAFWILSSWFLLLCHVICSTVIQPMLLHPTLSLLLVAHYQAHTVSVVEPFHFGPAPVPASQDGGSGSGSSFSSSPVVNNLLLKKSLEKFSFSIYRACFIHRNLLVLCFALPVLC